MCHLEDHAIYESNVFSLKFYGYSATNVICGKFIINLGNIRSNACGNAHCDPFYSEFV